MKYLKRATVLAPVMLIVAIAAPAALAASLPMTAATTAITNHAYHLMIDSNADNFRVSGCFRLNPHRVACHVNLYDVGNTRVEASFYSHAFWVGNSHKIHLGDTNPILSIE
jgi:hypothetical protein